MDLNQIAEFAKEYVLVQWPFIVVSILLGMIGHFMKVRVWTKTRAAGSKFFWWMRATLGLHAPASGCLVGITLCAFFGDQVPVGPGVDGQGQAILYYMGAGVVSSWVWSGTKNFLKHRGIVVEAIDLPGDSERPKADE